MSARDDFQAKISDSLAEFNKVACWTVLTVPQFRQYLAAHLAGDLLPEEEKTTPAGTAVTPTYSEGRIKRYTSALRAVDTHAQLDRWDDLTRFANAAMVAADEELNPVYRDAYGTGREHAGAAGWLLEQFEAVISTSNGDFGVAEEYRCRTCGAIGAQGTGPRSLLDLISMASRHECLPSLPGGDSDA